ncbi:MAG: glycosyltransferase family 1 protein [Candidatus Saccharibacteria bacterium]
MLIAIDARESGTTTGRYVDKLIEYIAKTNPDYDFNIITRSNRVAFFKKIAPKFYVYETEVKEFSFAEQLEYLKQIKEIDADLVHFSSVQQPIFYKGPVVTTMQDLTGTKTEFRNPSKSLLQFKIKNLAYKWVIRSAANKSKALIAPTEYVKRGVMKFTGQPASRFTVTYESGDKIKDKADPYKKLVGKNFIMYVGRPFPHKNLNRLIDAFEILQIKHPDLRLVLVGKKDANYDLIEAQAKSKVIKNIIFTDFVSEGQLRWLYENCGAYVFPSLSEGFGLPAMEAMVHGAPVASSNATCLPEVYGEAVQYFNPTDVNDMADNIARVLDDKELRDKLIKKGRKQAAKYSWERMAKQTLAVYDKVLND